MNSNNNLHYEPDILVVPVELNHLLTVFAKYMDDLGLRSTLAELFLIIT